MSISRNDANKINYKADIEWAKKRIYKITSEEDALKSVKEKTFDEKKLSPDEIIGILGDLSKKAFKLGDKIDFLSSDLHIPVDKEKHPKVSDYVNELDEESKGEYISYELYLKLIKQEKSAYDNLDISGVIEEIANDDESNSIIINSKISEGLEKSAENKPANYTKDNSLERYTNRYLNNIFSWNDHEYKIRKIINFSDNYLGNFPDPAYIPWTARRDMLWEERETNSLGDFWKNFSDSYTSEGKKMYGGIKNLAALRPDDNIQDITKRYISYANEFMNGINDTLGFNYTADLLCCFFQWSGRLDTKTLKGIRAMLQLLKTGLSFDFKNIIDSLKDIINNIFRGLLLDKIMGLIKNIYQRLVDPIKRWINNPDENWERVFVCTPVDELINKYLIGAEEYVEKYLNKMMRKLYKRIELKNIDFELKGTLLKEQKELGTIIEMIDVVIVVLEKSAVCGTASSPTGEPVQKIMEAYDLGPSKEYKYPEEDNPNIYNSFIPETPNIVDKGGGEKQSSSKTETAKFDTSVETGGKIKFDECLKKVMPDDFVGVTKWIEEINAEETKGST